MLWNVSRLNNPDIFVKTPSVGKEEIKMTNKSIVDIWKNSLTKTIDTE